MLLEEIIKPDAVLCNAHARSKKHCLEILSELLVRSIPEIGSETIFEGLIERERLGCTGLEAGVALPRCRVDGLERCVASLIKLSEAIDFDAADGEQVDLVFGLLVPSQLDDAHQADINLITGILKDAGLRARLREATSSKQLYESLLRGASYSAPERLQSAQGS